MGPGEPKRWEVWWIGLRGGHVVKTYRWRWQARLYALVNNPGQWLIGADPFEVRERTR